jgi:hypothetical protein
MAIEVDCPSCQSAVHVDDSFAGKDILCPNCQQRITVPSITSGQPGAMPRRGDESEERFEEGRGEGRSGREAMPRYRSDDDYDVPVRDDRARWNATLTGLALIFWVALIMTILGEANLAIALALGSDQPAFGGGNLGGNPGNAGATALTFARSGLGCVMIILFIIGFVGLCMCCTVPSESGAKGRAITTLLLIILGVVALIVFFIALFIAVFRQAAQLGGPPPPGQLPFSITGLLAMGIVAALGLLLIVTMWLMFHKAIANHFGNAGLGRSTVWFLVCYVVQAIGSNALQFMAHPQWLEGNLLAPPDRLMFSIAVLWAMAWLAGLSVWYLLIVRETRRTIMEDQAPTDDDRGFG